jgi:hypothetical protein
MTSQRNVACSTTGAAGRPRHLAAVAVLAQAPDELLRVRVDDLVVDLAAGPVASDDAGDRRGATAHGNSFQLDGAGPGA